MNYLQQFLLTFVVAAATAYLTSKFAYKSEVKKYLYVNREKLYFDLCEHLDLLIMNLSNIYDGNYRNTLYSYKPKVKMCGSSNVINAYKRLLNLFGKYDLMLVRFRQTNSPEYDETLIRSGVDEQGEYYEYFGGCYSDIENYEIMEKHYIDENLPDSNELSKIVNEIIDTMRKDLGNSKVSW